MEKNNAMNKENTATDSAETAHNDFFEHQSGAFFRRVDWSAFWTTFIISFGVYFFTLAPTVTLEDSGELAVASDYLGVPHPPGYPIWSLVTWFFQWVFHFGDFHGQPNPAWPVGLSSAFFGALACAMLGLLVSRSGADILRGVERATRVLGYAYENLICWVSGVTGGLLFAFSSVLWSQSTIVEVYSLNAFFLVLIILLTYRWMCRPHEDNFLYATAFIFGLGLTNHQSLLFIVFGLAAAVWFSDRRLFRDFVAVFFWLLAFYLFWKVYKVGQMSNPSETAVRSKSINTLFGVILLLAPGGLYLIERKLLTEWKRVLIVIALVALGVSFYAYMPISSEQNPPINWGYPRTVEGFKHAITRGQYEKINPVKNMQHAIGHPAHFSKMIWTVVLDPFGFISVVSQFLWIKPLRPFSLGALLSWVTLLIPLAALAPIAALFFIRRKARSWLIATLITFLSMTVIFLVFQYPKLDVQTLFIGRVQYIQAHAIFALWISYGLMFALTYIDTLARGRKMFVYSAAAVVLLMPLVLVARNAFDDEFIKIVGGCEQNGHYFGWEFGNWQLRGADGIRDDLEYYYGPEKAQEAWAEYPNPEYPPEMTTNAIFYGGTDPGRFVPTYMIYCAKVRPDVYLITQNALADNTYMNVMRDLYGDTIWIPSQQDSNYAFQKYVEDVQAGRIPPGAAVTFQDGRVSVQGVQGVMMINGILAKMIFEANKHKHDFYVEESYVIPWMYPYLEPHGLIMKINAQPLPDLSQDVIQKDRAFWDWEEKRLMNNTKFLRDVVARKTYSKLRSAIAGLYAYRHKFEEAEYAFKQAVRMYPLSPEANFRLADVYMQERRFTDARKLIEAFLKEDPDNDKVVDFLKQIRQTEQADQRRQELEKQFSSGEADLNAAMELASLYQRLNLQQRFEQLTGQMINDPNLPPQIYLQIGQLYANAKRFDLLEQALRKFLEKEPNNARVWVDLAAVQAATDKQDASLQSLKRAISLGGEAVREMVRKDQRFERMRRNPEFQRMVPMGGMGMGGNMPAPNFNLPFQGM
jgi:tetratricopeptide (TPR) repeat protein